MEGWLTDTQHKVLSFVKLPLPLTWVRAIDLNTKDQLAKVGFTIRLHTSWWLLLKTFVAAPSVVRQSISHDFFAISAKRIDLFEIS